jgi:DNA polymerase elongation subunit (family B)
MSKKTGPKVLILDIETAPIIASVWGLFDQNVPLNMIEKDWHIMSWSAKFLGESKIHYMDQRNSKDLENDKKTLEGLWKLMDEADVIVGQNSNNFDIKKINARFIIHGMQPPSSYKKIDTLLIARKHFAMTSNKLEYLSGKLCTKKKSQHKKFSGFDLWKECMKRNKAAWKEMESYNKADVLATEELYLKLRPWDNSLNVNLYHDTENTVCSCGSTKFQKNGHAYTSAGKFARYRCASCGTEARSRSNEFSKEKRESLKVKV